MVADNFTPLAVRCYQETGTLEVLFWHFQGVPQTQIQSKSAYKHMWGLL